MKLKRLVYRNYVLIPLILFIVLLLLISSGVLKRKSTSSRVRASEDNIFRLLPETPFYPGSLVGIQLKTAAFAQVTNPHFYYALQGSDYAKSESWYKLDTRKVSGGINAFGRLPQKAGTYLVVLNYQIGSNTCSANPAFVAPGKSGVLFGASLPLSQKTPCESLTTKIVVHETNTSTVYSMKNYWNLVPGYSFYYDGVHATKGKFSTYLEVEGPTVVCGLTTLPLRFTKDTSFGYWGGAYGEKDPSQIRQLRWFITYGTNQWPQEIGAIGDKRYQAADSPLTKIGTDMGGYVYGTGDAHVPYRLSGISERVGNFFYREDSIDPVSLETNDACGKMNSSGQTPTHGWYTLLRKGPSMTVFGISRPTLQITFLEGPVPLVSENSQQNSLLREDWILMDGVGIVSIADETFGSYGSFYQTKDCLEDIVECLGPTLTKPIRKLTLNAAYRGEALSLTPSPATVQLNGAYSVISSHKALFGTVEVKDQNRIWKNADGSPIIFLKGVAQTKPLTGFPAGTYSGSFRKEIIRTVIGTHETRAAYSNTFPWSNVVTVRISQ